MNPGEAKMLAGHLPAPAMVLSRLEGKAMHEHAERLVPELAKWNNGAGIDVLTWVGCVGRFDHAIGYAALFWPDFAVRDHCLLLQPLNVDTFKNWMSQCKGDLTAVERVMNHRHIADLFGGSDFEPTSEALLHLGRLLRDMWSCELARDFPGRRAKLEFRDTRSQDLLDCVITVYQEREITSR